MKTVFILVWLATGQWSDPDPDYMSRVYSTMKDCQADIASLQWQGEKPLPCRPIIIDTSSPT